MAKTQSAPTPTLQKKLKSKDPKKKHRWCWKRKVLEKEVKCLEAVVAKMRAELNHMERAERKAKARLGKLQRRNSKTREANRQAAMNDARIQLFIDAILHHLDD
ncbi:uncharacterized protein LOC111276639 [Durio zibethinus]|uniref:Uncharacterized protein LOC111276639 n=1 Tax=Durio zibethinus TaxID=66656 RepID=A0A6P5WPR5_DURZI|nr:uncharacterized protein LOC111276639 [Durio zibethinus]